MKIVKITDLFKQEVDQKVNYLIDSILKPRCIKPPELCISRNYCVNIYAKWHGRSLFFWRKFNSRGDNTISPSFEIKFARMVYIGDEKFNLSYMRYNNKWSELHRDITLQQCLNSINEEPYFMVSFG